MRVARRWLAAGDRVYAVTRMVERAIEFEELGLVPIVADVAEKHTLRWLPTVDDVVYCVGQSWRRDAGTIDPIGPMQGVMNFAERLPPPRGKFVYVSTTGVYEAPADGGWVDEDSPVAPSTYGAEGHLAGEGGVSLWPCGERLVILRMAGLYGPGRLPRRAELLAGEPITAAEAGFLNLIHIDDAATAVVVAAERAPTPAVYNVTDGCPVPRREYLCELARLIGAPPPTFVAPEAAAPRQRGSVSKRVSGARICRELGLAWQYADYRQGLAQAIAAT